MFLYRQERGDLKSQGGAILWKGKVYMTGEEYAALSRAEHAALPWEREAITQGRAKAVAFLSNQEALRGLDPVLDMILDMGPL